MTPHSDRIADLRAILEENEIDGFLITNPHNIRWLSNFQGSYSRLLITGEKALLATDSRYWIQARTEAPHFSLFQDSRKEEDTRALLAQGSVKRIAFEADHLTWREAQTLIALEDYHWKPLSGQVERLRRKKDSRELSLIKKAAAVTDKVMSQLPNLLKPGISEAELSWQLHQRLRDEGATALAFPIIAAFGPNSALPHHHPGPRKLEQNSIVLIDMGAEVDGYKSDLTRTYFYGTPDDKFLEIFDLVNTAQIAAIEGLKAGVMSGIIHHLAMDVIAEGGYGDFFPHGLGHSIGLEIHETPFLSYQRDDVELQQGMIFTVEPGIYLEKWGGIRIEDLLLVTGEGCQWLSQCPKDPIIHL